MNSEIIQDRLSLELKAACVKFQDAYKRHIRVYGIESANQIIKGGLKW